MELPFDKIAPTLTHPLVLIGFCIMLFFGVLRVMTSAGILPALSKGVAGDVIRIIIKYGFALAVLIIVLGFSLEFFKVSKLKQQKPELSPNQRAAKTVIDLKHQIWDLRGTFETVDDFPEEATAKVRTEAPQLAKLMLNNTKDDLLVLGHRITKYSYGGLAYLLAAEVETNKGLVKMYSIKSVKAFNQSLQLIDEAHRTADGSDLYYNNLIEWIESEQVADWVNYNKAIALAVRANTEGNGDQQIVQSTLSQIPPAYLSKYPITANPFLKISCAQFTDLDLKMFCTGGLR
jgi:hypothetical protein